MIGGLVQIDGGLKREDGLQVRRLLDGRFELGHRKIADAEHADVAIRPRLSRGPLDQVVHVATFLGVEEPEGAT